MKEEVVEEELQGRVGPMEDIMEDPDPEQISLTEIHPHSLSNSKETDHEQGIHLKDQEDMIQTMKTQKNMLMIV